MRYNLNNGHTFLPLDKLTEATAALLDLDGATIRAALERLTEQFARLPGIGGKTAQRLAFHVLSLPQEEAKEFAQAILDALEAKGILGGQPVEGGLLWCATELVTKAEMDQAVSIVKEVCGQ